jgi:hypothetical protein
MSRSRDTLLILTLLALVSSGPVALAAYLISADRALAPVTLAAAGDSGSAPGATAAGAPGARTGSPLLTGVLYTRGTARVNWNGVVIPVEDGSYAYLGGEVISTGPASMGVLQLDSDNTAYLCPDSRMSLTRADEGGFHVTISEGGGRFAFAPGTDYRIEANQGVLTPSADGARSEEPAVMEVAVFQRHPGGVICGFSGHLDVAGYPPRGGGGPIALGRAGPGEIVDLSRALRDEAASSGAPVVIQPIPMPSGVRSWLQRNAPYPPRSGPIGYLCRCLELKRYAEADGIPDAAIRPRMLPPEGEALSRLPPDIAPPAEPGAPDAADLAVLSGSVSTITVPPPLVPLTGSGGGTSSTPF